MVINLDEAKKNVDFLGGYKGDENRLFVDLDSQNKTLTQLLEEKDPSEKDENGNPLNGHDALHRILMAYDIQISGQKAIRVEQLAQKALVLMPELVLREIRAGMALARRSSISKLIAVTITQSGPSYHPAYIPDMNRTAPQSTVGKSAKSLAKRAVAGKGGMFPKTSLRYREKDIKIKDYGRELEVSYKLLRNMPWTEFRIFLNLIGVQLAADKMFDIYDLGVTGDGTVGAASNVFNGTAASLVYTDIVHAYLSYDQGFELNAFLCPVTSLETILTMPQYQDPQAGFKFQRTGELVTPVGGELFQVDTAPSGAPTATVIVTLDRRFAVRETISQPLMVESKKIIELKFEDAVISEESVFSIIADGALKRIVWT